MEEISSTELPGRSRTGVMPAVPLKRGPSVAPTIARLKDGSAFPAWVGPAEERLPRVLVALIVVVALLLRAVGLVDNPAGFFCDEASIQYDAYLVLHTGMDRWGVHLPFYFRSFGDYESPLFIYMSLPVIALMGLDPAADRLVAALFGTGTVLLMYPLARELFRRRDIAVLAAASLAIAPWHLLFSRVAFEAISMPFFYALATWSLLAGLRRHHRALFLAGFLFYGLSLYTYHVPRLLTQLLLGALCVIYWRPILKWWRVSALGVLIYGVCMVPLAYSIFVTGEATARFGLIGVFSQGLHGWALVSKIWAQYVQHFSVDYLFVFGSHPGDPITRNYIPGMGALYWADLPLVMVGIVALLVRAARRDRASLLVLAWLLVYPTGGALTEGPTQLRVMFGVLPWNLVIGYGAAEIWRGLRWAADHTPTPVVLKAAGALLAVVALVVSLAQLWTNFYVQYPRITAGYWGWQDGPRFIIPYFSKIHTQYDQLFLTGSFNSPEIFYNFYDPNRVCANCTIGGLDNYNPRLHQVFALRPEEVSPLYRYHELKDLYYGDGTLAYRIVEPTGTTSGSSGNAQPGRGAAAGPSIGTPTASGGTVAVVRVLGAGLLRQPRAIAVLPSGGLAVADTGNSSLTLLAPDGKLARKVTAGGTAAGGSASLAAPFGVVHTPGGLLAVVDAVQGRVDEYRSDGSLVRSFGDRSQLVNARDLAVAPDGHLFVANPATNSVTEYASDGTLVSSIHTPLSKEPGAFNQVSAMALGPDGLLYVLDNVNQRVEALDRTGRFHGQWAAPASDTMFSARVAIVGPPRARWLLVSDPGHDALFAYPINRLGGDRTPARRFTLSGVGVPGGPTLAQPAGMAFGPSGTVFVADSGSSVVWQLHLVGL